MRGPMLAHANPSIIALAYSILRFLTPVLSMPSGRSCFLMDTLEGLFSGDLASVT